MTLASSLAPRSHRLGPGHRLLPLVLLATIAAGEDAEPARYNFHAQSTVVEQWDAAFHSPYAGQNSLPGAAQDRHTVTLTLFLDGRIAPALELCVNPEVSQGGGLSDTTGLAGFPNGEASRAGGSRPEFNTARLFLRWTSGLGGETEKVEDDQNQLAGTRAVDRITVTFGKVSAEDFFDGNSYAHDPRTQFLNMALTSNTAWDYPADVKGYTGGLVAEWSQPARTLRWGAFLEPAIANERQLDSHLAKALGQAWEWEERYQAGERHGALRLLAYWNRAHMGSYALAMASAAPDVTLSRAYRSKVGLGLNWEQELAGDLGAFARAGWNDGRAETWAYTEVDSTFTAGLSLKGARWGRPKDTVGLAAVANGLSSDHRRYLAAGGYGFMVGDGRLAYGPEEILEIYYDWKPLDELALAFDFQEIRNPGYNRDRGPVPVFAVRAHWER